MEKKKLLLVTISVGVFLVIVIGASIMVFSPRNPASAVTVDIPARPVPPGVPETRNPSIVPDSAVTSGIAGSPVPTPGSVVVETGQPLIQVQPATADPADMVRNSGSYQTLQVPPASPSAVQENRFYINNDSTQPILIERKEGDANTRVVINVPRPSTAAVPDVSPASRPSPVPAARREETAVSQAGRNTAASNTKTAVKTPDVPARTTAPVARSVPPQQQSRSYNAYWVQTGSFPTRTQADKAREILASKGLTAIIENGDVKGKTWYRVRVGPYTSQNEADYWLSLIKSINGKPYIDLASSIVWQSSARP